ncbi:DUF4169 family protein [Arenibacterium sp. LLYu02]|uniref:DUF4169 family protein n=1 Tax=Arenibacterium sp. LLYu02 TaxID=3404132 RepID=UPI003B214FC8
MSEIVNFNKFRKEKARADKKARADENAVKFGRTKAEKLREKIEQTRQDKQHDGHKLEE